MLGLHNYWFGLEDHDYRSWFVSLSWSADDDSTAHEFQDWLDRHPARLLGMPDDPTYGVILIYEISY